MKLLSHTEASAVLECQAKHAFRYTGALTRGMRLKQRVPRLNLRRGKAWGAGVAALHESGGSLSDAVVAAAASLVTDENEMREAGVYTGMHADEHEQTLKELEAFLQDYPKRASILHGFHGAETELRAEIPGTSYTLQAFLDGLWRDENGRLWFVEFKLREGLSPRTVLEMDRQIRWYAWAWLQVHGEEIAGVIYDERLAEVPGPVKLNKDGTPRAKQAGCTAEDYAAGFEAVGKEPDEETMEKLRAKRFGQRITITFTHHELAEAGAQLVTVAKMLTAFYDGRLYPVKNPGKATCPRCDFRDICPDPLSVWELVEGLFTLAPPKGSEENAEMEVAR